MQIGFDSTISPSYTGANFSFLLKDETPLETTTYVTLTAQLGKYVKGNLKVKKCSMVSLDKDPSSDDFIIGDLIKNEEFVGEIKNVDGTLVFSSTTPIIGKYSSDVSCDYTISDDFEMDTSVTKQLIAKHGEAPMDIVSFRSTKKSPSDSYFGSYEASLADGTPFRVKVGNLKSGHKFVSARYSAYTLPSDAESKSTTKVAKTYSCDLTTISTSGEERSVVTKTISVEVDGTAYLGLNVDWDYSLPVGTNIGDIDLHCPELKLKSYSPLSLSQFIIHDTILDPNGRKMVRERVKLRSGASSSGVLLAVGIVASALAFFL